MGSETDFLDGKSFTLLELLRKVTEYKGVEISEGASKAESKPIKEYVLGKRRLAYLAEAGIKRQPRLDHVFTLVDKNPQAKFPGRASSNYWNFEPLEERGSKFDLRIFLSVGFQIIATQGFVCMPVARGSFLSPCEKLPNLRMFKALVERDPYAPSVAKELAASDGEIIITWSEIGLSGLRLLTSLFMEFINGNQQVEQLARHNDVFNPTPFPERQDPSNTLYVAKSAQAELKELWGKQLNEYRNSLII